MVGKRIIARIPKISKQGSAGLINCNCYCLIFLLVLCPEPNTQVIMVLAMEQPLCWTFVGLQWEPLCEESVGFVSVSSQLLGRAQTCCHNSYTALPVFAHSLGSTSSVFSVVVFLSLSLAFLCCGTLFITNFARILPQIFKSSNSVVCHTTPCQMDIAPWC